MLRLISAILLAAGLASCAHRDQASAPTALKGLEHPAWVSRGSGAFDDDSRRVFYGVGSVHGLRNPSLARSTADNRARAEIAKIFTTYSSVLMRDYSASTRAGALPTASAAPTRTDAAPGVHEEQDVEEAIKTFAAASLPGVQISDHWYHPTDGSIYALARLDLDALTDSLERMNEVSRGMREFIRGHAAEAHRALEAEEDHQRGVAP